ncbi:hypothetical protein DENIS_2627 [Desulfonema ishimotonii]|uniref:Uncharacterized protein n=1 Tax=Desulfonema ishimotonii TaxID=45657 RepID=A0A401FXI1_9BACT|nr:hypothetical protein [Desulfonema ishimotonii]GBC61665.1 hypothetical protein DENIS_2627 [Desulfonema ishimotonii]
MKLFQGVVVILLLTGLVAACGKEAADVSPENPESFTFFDIGANTPLNDGLRKALRDKLGDAAVEKRNVIDLTVNSGDFMKQYLPRLDSLNRRLNSDVGIRVEHSTEKLRYRYMQKKNTPFSYVELLFSDYTKKPLLFRITSDRAGAEIAETLKKKYGPPRVAGAQGRVFYWEKNRDVLMLSLVSDQFGNPGYEIIICYVNSFEALLQRESSEGGREKENTIPGSVKDAF